MADPRSSKPITRQTVAERAGVSTFTVSQALAGKAGVSARTRERVLRVAKSLGYQVNSAASLLAQQKYRPGVAKVRIAFLHHQPKFVRDFPAHCQEDGVDGAVLNPAAFESPKQMLRTLWHQGFQGLLFNFRSFPWAESDLAGCDFAGFSVFKTSRLYPALPFHLIRHSAFDYTRLLLHKALETGAKRVAIFLPAQSGSFVDDDARLGAVLALQERLRGQDLDLHWAFLGDQNHRGAMFTANLDWLAAIRPQVILGYTSENYRQLEAAGWRMPDQAGFAAMLVGQEHTQPVLHPQISGCASREQETQRRSIRLLKEMVGRGERGFPAVSTEHVVEPSWLAGETLQSKRSIPASKRG